MRFRTVAVAVLVLTLSPCHLVTLSSALGQSRQPPKIHIDKVQVGFLSGQGSGFKAGSWTPVFVDLTAGDNPLGRGDGDIVVQTNDSDDMENYYTVPLPQLDAREQGRVMTFARTANASSDLQVVIRAKDGRVLAAEKPSRTAYSPFGPGSYLYLTAGSQRQAMREALFPRKAGQEEDDSNADQTHCFAWTTDPKELPTRWFGYSSVDLMLLQTADQKFMEDLLADSGNRKEALAEWVRRGGRLVISVGRNHQLVKSLFEKMPLIGCNVTGSVQREQLTRVVEWSGGVREPFTARGLKGGQAKLEIARLEIEPRRGVENMILEPPSADDNAERPVMVQAPCGLGRVVLVAFDLETEPFMKWAGRPKFLKKLQQTLQPLDQAEKQDPNNPQGGMPGIPGWGGDRNEIATHLQNRLQSFEDVPVISFGWVALFILLYIIVVGPLDYFFLKKVVKRLELTWITFPAVVLLVSAVAYFSAYYLKGNDLRINKLDLVDIVAELDEKGAHSEGTRAYGSTWFTLFSPRIQNYIVGVEPGWTANVNANPNTPRNPYSTVVTWFGSPENTWGNVGGGSPGLFRRAYDYAPDATGLVGVPIQVWSTKSFNASWQEQLPEGAPLFSAELSHPPADVNLLTGTITNHLPVALQDTWLFYRGHCYELGRLEAGEMRIDDLVARGKEKQMEQWLNDTHWYMSSQPNQPNFNPRYGNRPQGNQTGPMGMLLKPMLFNEADKNSNNRMRNSSLRQFDQSWRLKRTDEVILVGRAASGVGLDKLGSAEKVTQDGVSASQLWLGKLHDPKDPKETRPPLAGLLLQETYVRVFLPVAPTEIKQEGNR
jgi:hypothetical protein